VGLYPARRGKDSSGGRFFSELPRWCAQAVELWCLATGLLALALAFGHSIVSLFFLAGSGVSALAGTLIFVKNLIGVFRTARDHLENRFEYEFKARGPDLLFLDEVVTWGKREIGHAHPDGQTITSRLSENQGVLNVYVRERSDGRSSFCGYVLVYPIERERGEAVLAGEVRCEAELGPEALSCSFRTAPYLYVGMVLGTDKHARSQVKDKLRMLLIKILSEGNFERVFARPGSRGGLQMMKHYGFLPIADPEDVWSISAQRLKARLLAEESLSSAIVVQPEVDEQAAAPQDKGAS
jgi:hypothetical protein